MPNWQHIKFPALDENDKSLWPERYNTETLLKIKAAVGSYTWAGLYQQEPSPAEGGIIKRAWFKYYKAYPAKFDEIKKGSKIFFP